MTALATYKSTLDISRELEAFATKEQLAECAQILALKVAYYEQEYGKLARNEWNAYNEISDKYLSEDHIKLMAQGMNNLIGVLATVIYELNSAEASSLIN